MWWVIVIVLVTLLPVVYLAGRRSERATMKDWELVLTPRGQRALQTMSQETHAELALVDLTYEQAQDAAADGDIEQTLRLLDLGCRLIEGYCPTMLRSLAAMSVLSRMVAAMAPVRPLRPRAFKLRQIANLAYLNSFFHHFLVTTGERFRLRLYILARGFVAVMRVVTRATGDARDRPDASPEWKTLESARKDVRTLSEDSLEAFRVLLVSMEAERRP
jgi:hypothetical protein